MNMQELRKRLSGLGFGNRRRCASQGLGSLSSLQYTSHTEWRRKQCAAAVAAARWRKTNAFCTSCSSLDYQSAVYRALTATSSRQGTQISKLSEIGLHEVSST
ncbi:hypothetical protein AMELA_G00263710 [Ameiurus melas]|uniref:Uncharacterized protein n=1 Tax=Ameiurus melas TaxID=219545 RepID=A0A7J5ZRH5_AMEME|nr:hypothetical protein AMELA_G00263710 [Ameiurus melas]